MKKIFTFLLICIIGAYNTNAQSTYDFGFTRSSSIVVKDSLGNNLEMPWAGGLNAVHFEQIDLNRDGIKDLITFDTHGDRLMTYINSGQLGTNSYTYAPQYEKLFPKCYSWLQTYDYDNDGKMDIFTYTSAGIKVYRNTSSGTTLSFTMVSPMLLYSTGGPFDANIYVSSVDFPAFTDVDFDGDMDILTFHVLGGFVIWYRNYSMEEFGTADSLNFKIGDKCWGKFAEGENNNAVYLNQYCNYKTDDNPGLITSPPNIKHTGSTLLSINLNGDTLMDLLLGDVDYFTINSLINGGSRDTALIVSQDTTFPDSDPINIVTFPLVNYIDIDNDGTKELIASPFDPSYYKVNGSSGIWLYDNAGQNDNPIFQLSEVGFFQNKMIDVGDGAIPEVADVDGDGLMDLLVSNYGDVDSTYLDSVWYLLEVYKISRVTYYKNVGTASSPSFKYMDGNWLGLNSLDLQSLKLSFGDIDSDGDKDLLIGSNDGKLIYKENLAGANQPMSFGPAQMNFNGIDVGDFSTPQIIDINGDSLLDLVIGNKLGHIVYYQNTGTSTNPIFTHITDKMGNVKTSNYFHYYNGYSVPNFYYDNNDSLRAFVGSASGFCFYYRDIRNNVTDTFGIDSNLLYTDIVDTLYSLLSFTNEDNVLETAATGLRSAPVIYDFDNDGFLDILVGTFSGGINYFKGITSPSIGVKETKNLEPDISLYPNPAKGYFNIDISKNQNIKSSQIRIYDISGRLIYKNQYGSENIIKQDISEFTNGIYIVNIQLLSSKGGIQSKTFKLIKY
jgi:hypothetical protein